jgi:hypothetical protein
MAYTVSEDFAAHSEIGSKLQALLNAITGNFVACGVEKVGLDRFLVWVAEVAT